MNTQEKIVCPAVKITFANGGEKDEVVMPYIKSHKDEYHIFLLLIKLGIWRTKRYTEELGFATSNQRFVDPVEAMRIAVKAEQVGGILWKKVEARMLNDCGFIDRSKVKGKAIDETIKSYLEFPLKPEDLY